MAFSAKNRCPSSASSLPRDKDNNNKSKPSGVHPSAQKARTKSKLKLPVVTSPNLETQLQYARNGHTVLRSLLPPETLQILQKQLQKYVESNKLLAYQQKVAVAYNDNQLAASLTTLAECQDYLQRAEIHSLPFLQFFHTWKSIPLVLELAETLAPVAAQLLDCSSIRLYQDAIFYKTSAAGGVTPWHVDARMAPFDTSNMLTFWIPLQNIPIDGSGLIFCSKSHADFALPFWTPYDESGKDSAEASPWNTLEERYKNDLVHYMPLETGDVTVHSGWTLHCANGCQQGEERWALAISLVDAQAPVRAADDDTKRDNEDMWSYREWLHQVYEQPKQKMYQIWHHPLVPVLWPPSKRTKLR